MRSSRQGAIPSELSWLIDELDGLARRLRVLESPSGEALSSSVKKLQDLVADMQAQFDQWAATRWTNAEITTQINTKVATPGAISPTSVTASGNVSAGGTLTVTGATQLNGSLRVPDAYNFDITYTRRTAWLGDDGRLGYASSALEKKTDIRAASADVNLTAILDVEPKSFIYRAELARRTQLRIDEGVDYVPRRELGLIAEDLAAAGLGGFVIRDASGKPEGIEYSMLSVALLAVARAQRTALAELLARVQRLETPLG